MKTNHDGTITLNAYDTWTSCVACGQKVTGDSIHTCSPQLKQLTDEEIKEVIRIEASKDPAGIGWNLAFNVARAILRKAQENVK